jgi:transcriptional regulator with XRE-family HTH domain
MTNPLDWQEIGARLRQARLAAGYSQDKLGQLIGLDRTMVAKCETGTRRLDAVELTRVATALGQPLAYFLSKPPEVLSRRTVLIDEHDTAAARDTFRLETELSVWLRDVRQLMDFGALSPASPMRYPHAVRDSADARDAATWLRRRLNLHDRPLGTLVEVAELAGQLVLVTDVPGEGASAVDGDVAVAVVSTHREPGRRRSTAAHELGHMVLGDEYSSDLGVHSSRDEREQAVEAFAAEFLLPVRIVETHATHDSDEAVRLSLIKLAANYRVSWTLMLQQAAYAGALSERRRAFLATRVPTHAEFMKALGWAPQPDFESVRVPPSVADAVLAAVQDHRITPRRAAELTRGQITERDYHDTFEAGEAGD